jgi:hypothetical protein
MIREFLRLFVAKNAAMPCPYWVCAGFLFCIEIGVYLSVAKVLFVDVLNLWRLLRSCSAAPLLHWLTSHIEMVNL